jgi:N-acetylneuraminic acid mutarotase
LTKIEYTILVSFKVTVLNQLLKIIKKINISAAVFIIIMSSISCSDNLDDMIKEENKQPGITDDDIDNSWIKLGDIATPRAGAAVTVSGDRLYIYGGETYTGVLDDFWRYNLSTGEYQILVSNGARAYATLVELNGNLYRFGGRDALVYYDKQNDGIYYYITSSRTWNSFRNSDTNGNWPAERSHHIAVPLYSSTRPVESIFFHGGKDAGGNMEGDLYEFDLSVYKHDIINYTQTSSLIRSEHSAVYYDNNIYFFGGYASGTYYNDLWKFNITSSDFMQVITTGITIIPVRSGISMIEHDSKLYVFGGQNGTSCFNDLWSFSVAGNSWTKISTAPVKRCFYSAVKYNNSLIIFGGYYLNSFSQKVYSSELWEYKLQ